MGEWVSWGDWGRKRQNIGGATTTGNIEGDKGVKTWRRVEDIATDKYLAKARALSFHICILFFSLN